LQAWDDQSAHPALTEKAAISTVDEYLKNQIGLRNGKDAQILYDFPEEIQIRINRANRDGERTQRTVIDWLETGSAIEDADTFLHRVSDKAKVRPRHHFHDPTRNAGQNNRADNPDWSGYPTTWPSPFDLTGESALTWAVNGTAAQDPTVNDQSWQNARGDFYNALTRLAQSEREEFLAMTFLDLGCVLHMLEDMGVPAHTRNDFLFAHYRNKNDNGDPLEGFVARHMARGSSLSRWLPQGYSPTPKVFSTVRSYFDTDIRPDPATTEPYLGGSIPDTWGLAECTNYQFFSWSTIARPATTLYFFQHPDLANTTPLIEGVAQYQSGYGLQYLTRQTMSRDHLIYPNNLDPDPDEVNVTFAEAYTWGSYEGQLDYPMGSCVVGSSAQMYLADTGNHRIQNLSALHGPLYSEISGYGTHAGQFDSPSDVCYDINRDQIIVTDTGNNRLQIFQVDNSGELASGDIAFIKEISDLGLLSPSSVACSSDGISQFIYVADTGNNRVLKVTTSTDDPGSTPLHTFETYKGSLWIDDIPMALTCISDASFGTYSEILYAIESDLQDFASGMGTMTLDSYEPEKVKYEMQHIDGLDTYSFPVIFSKDDDGNWKIFSF
jgi:hypothetical protein